MENTDHTKYIRLIAALLAGILLISSIVGYIISQKMNKGGAVADKQTPTPIVPLPTPTMIPYPTKGSLVLVGKTGATAQVGMPFTLNVIATSSKDTVAGYDVILSYDKVNLERQLVQSIAPAFRIFTYERGDHLSISATKNLSVTDLIQFSQTPILSFIFTAKKKGTYTFSLKPVGNESSKFVNEAAAVTYPETKDISIEIQ